MPLGNSSAADKLLHPKLAEKLQVPVATLFGSTAEFGDSIVIRRGGSSLPSQNVRLAPLGRGMSSVRESAGAEQRELGVFVIGGPALDIQAGDRFNDANGTLYQVFYVRPHRQIQTVAEARAVQ